MQLTWVAEKGALANKRWASSSWFRLIRDAR
jgi:hypothetical protein